MFNCLYEQFGSDTIRNVLALIAVVIALIGLIVRIIRGRRRKHFAAFIAMLNQHLVQLSNHMQNRFTCVEGWKDLNISFSPAFIALSHNANIAHSQYDRNEPKLKEEINRLSNFANEFLQFLRGSSVPKAINCDIEKLTKFLHDLVVSKDGTLLNDLSFLTGSPRFDKTCLVCKVLNYVNELQALISSIHSKLVKKNKKKTRIKKRRKQNECPEGHSLRGVEVTLLCLEQLKTQG